VLDDQVQYGRSLERVLRKEYRVVLANSLVHAQSLMSAGYIDLVVTDIRLDETNQDDRQGIAFIQWLRERDVGIPIISISAIDDSQLERDALQAGATRFLHKPIRVSQLKKTLHQVLLNVEEPIDGWTEDKDSSD
jgi:DNA-binding NtrC family response regulator